MIIPRLWRLVPMIPLFGLFLLTLKWWGIKDSDGWVYAVSLAVILGLALLIALFMKG